MKKTNKIEKPPHTSASVYSEFFCEIVTFDVTRTSVLAFVSSVRSPFHFLLLGYGGGEQYHLSCLRYGGGEQYHLSCLEYGGGEQYPLPSVSGTAKE